MFVSTCCLYLHSLGVIVWVGDPFQIPTVGIAVDPARIPLDDAALQSLVRANK